MNKRAQGATITITYQWGSTLQPITKETVPLILDSKWCTGLTCVHGCFVPLLPLCSEAQLAHPQGPRTTCWAWKGAPRVVHWGYNQQAGDLLF
ncbi:hypothetical protein QCA50_017089 [Cerrena zonata]|uniref:Uncharacterized protein n=1 Tax=Cerrena zonata TaxID=2478898 RepID=A0AAW0FNX0_9APHY